MKTNWQHVAIKQLVICDKFICNPGIGSTGYIVLVLNFIKNKVSSHVLFCTQIAILQQLFVETFLCQIHVAVAGLWI